MNKYIKECKYLGTLYAVAHSRFREKMAHHKHEHGGASGIPCTGSYKLQNSVTKAHITSSQHSQHSLSASPQPNDRINNHHMQASPKDDLESADPPTMVGQARHIFNNSKWRTLMNRVPKAAWAQCATIFCNILTKISTDSTNLDSWACLFSFATNILAKSP